MAMKQSLHRNKRITVIYRQFIKLRWKVKFKSNIKYSFLSDTTKCSNKIGKNDCKMLWKNYGKCFRKEFTFKIASLAVRIGVIWNTCHILLNMSILVNTLHSKRCRWSWTESSSNISFSPTWIYVGGKPVRSANKGETKGEVSSDPAK